MMRTHWIGRAASGIGGRLFAALLVAVPTSASCSSGPSCSSMGCPAALTIQVLPKSSESLPVGTYEIQTLVDGAPGTVTCYSEPDLGTGCTGDDIALEVLQRFVDGKLEYFRLTSFEPVKVIDLAISRNGTSILTTTLKPDYPPPIPNECGEGCSYTSVDLYVD